MEDLLRFAQALQGHKLLNKEYTDLDMTGKVNTDRGDRYAYGMVEARVNGVRIVGHSGGFPGINSQLDMYPDLGYTVAIMSNYDGAAQPVIGRFRLELTGQQLPRAIRLPADELQAFAGKYAAVPPPDAPPGMRMPPMQITADKDGLLVDVGRGGPGHRFVPLSPQEFFDENSPSARIVFAKDEKGRMASATMMGMGPTPIKATRMP